MMYIELYFCAEVKTNASNVIVFYGYHKEKNIEL